MKNLTTTLIACNLLLLVAAAAAPGSICPKKPLPKPVNLTIYYESLCPYCRAFFQQQLVPTYVSLGAGILNPRLVPFGNARITGECSMECQHGPKECENNRLMACVQKYASKDTYRIVETLSCLFSEPPEDCLKRWLPNVDRDILEECQTSGESFDMMVEFAAESSHIRYVPWLELNGVHDEKIQIACDTNLRKCICDAYTGGDDKCDQQ